MRSKIVAIHVLIALAAAPTASAHPCLCNGDANLDGVFNEQDCWFTIDCLGQPPIDVCTNADINCDGSIDSDDIDPNAPFSGDTAILCIQAGMPPEECCPGHMPCGAATAGNCCEPNDTQACSDLDCCVAVCSGDSFCCSFWWDSTCAEAALEQCGVPAACDFPADCDEDGDVDLSDYSVLSSCLTGANGAALGDGCECADLDGDGDVDVHDFRQLQVRFTGPF